MMPTNKVQNKNLVNLLEDYWREIVKGFPKTEDSGVAANLKDANSLVSKWKIFGNRVLKATNAICVFNCRIPVVYYAL
jgi:DNA/RNA endonuclease G (NUC1)